MMKWNITVQLIVYFSNHCLPKTWYDTEAGTALIVSQDVRWNLLNDSLQCYLKSSEKIVKFCEGSRDDTGRNANSEVIEEKGRRLHSDFEASFSCVTDEIENSDCTVSKCVFIRKC